MCERDRLGGVSGKGITRDVFVRERYMLGGVSGKGRHRDVCV